MTLAKYKRLRGFEVRTESAFVCTHSLSHASEPAGYLVSAKVSGSDRPRR